VRPTPFETINGVDRVPLWPDAVDLGDELPEPESEFVATWADDDAWDEAAIPQRPWIAPGYALRRAVTAVAGPGGAGKSMLVLAWSIALALNRPHGRFVPGRPCRVMVYNVEDDRDEQRRRLSGALRYFNAQPSDLRGKLKRLGPTQVGTLLDKERVDTEAMKELKRHIEDFRPDVLFLDPFVELHSEEENDNGALRAVVATFRALAVHYDMAVVLLHHTRKGAAGSPGDPDIFRGASATISAARVGLTVLTMGEEDAKAFAIKPISRKFYFRVDDAKQNYGPPQEAEWFEKASYQLGNGESVAAAVPWTPPKDTITTELWESVAAGVARGNPLPWAKRLSDDPRSIRKLFEKHGITTPAGQKHAIERLEQEGFAVAKFTGPDRKPAQGFRAPCGGPTEVVWRDE
jgi:hypothetical protein